MNDCPRMLADNLEDLLDMSFGPYNEDLFL